MRTLLALALSLFVLLFSLSVAGGLFLLWSAISAMVARAHDAPQGWSYAISCCSGMDCHEIPSEAVRETSEGYHITLTPEQHDQLVKPVEYVVPYGDPKIKDAPDGVFHACIGKQFLRDNGETHGGNLICLYVPPRGF